MTGIRVTTEHLPADAATWRAWGAALAAAAAQASALPGLATVRDWSLLPGAQEARAALGPAMTEFADYLRDGAARCEEIATKLSTTQTLYDEAEQSVLGSAPKG